jgi:hypothetical protein
MRENQQQATINPQTTNLAMAGKPKTKNPQ